MHLSKENIQYPHILKAIRLLSKGYLTWNKLMMLLLLLVGLTGLGMHLIEHILTMDSDLELFDNAFSRFDDELHCNTR